MERKEKKRKQNEESKEAEKKTKTENVGKMKSYSVIKKPEMCTDASVYLSAVLGIVKIYYF